MDPSVDQNSDIYSNKPKKLNFDTITDSPIFKASNFNYDLLQNLEDSHIPSDSSDLITPIYIPNFFDKKLSQYYKKHSRTIESQSNDLKKTCKTLKENLKSNKSDVQDAYYNLKQSYNTNRQKWDEIDNYECEDVKSLYGGYDIVLEGVEKYFRGVASEIPKSEEVKQEIFKQSTGYDDKPILIKQVTVADINPSVIEKTEETATKFNFDIDKIVKKTEDGQMTKNDEGNPIFAQSVIENDISINNGQFNIAQNASSSQNVLFKNPDIFPNNPFGISSFQNNPDIYNNKSQSQPFQTTQNFSSQINPFQAPINTNLENPLNAAQYTAKSNQNPFNSISNMQINSLQVPISNFSFLQPNQIQTTLITKETNLFINSQTDTSRSKPQTNSFITNQSGPFNPSQSTAYTAHNQFPPPNPVSSPNHFQPQNFHNSPNRQISLMPNETQIPTPKNQYQNQFAPNNPFNPQPIQDSFKTLPSSHVQTPGRGVPIANLFNPNLQHEPVRSISVGNMSLHEYADIRSGCMNVDINTPEFKKEINLAIWQINSEKNEIIHSNSAGKLKNVLSRHPSTDIGKKIKTYFAFKLVEFYLESSVNGSDLIGLSEQYIKIILSVSRSIANVQDMIKLEFFFRAEILMVTNASFENAAEKCELRDMIGKPRNDIQKSLNSEIIKMRALGVLWGTFLKDAYGFNEAWDWLKEYLGLDLSKIDRAYTPILCGFLSGLDRDFALKNRQEFDNLLKNFDRFSWPSIKSKLQYPAFSYIFHHLDSVLAKLTDTHIS